jgi:hypothetical protein
MHYVLSLQTTDSKSRARMRKHFFKNIRGCAHFQNYSAGVSSRLFLVVVLAQSRAHLHVYSFPFGRADEAGQNAELGARACVHLHTLKI